MRREVDEVRIFVLNLVEPRLDVLHVVDIFDHALFAGGDDQALLAVHERNLGDFLDRHKRQIVFGRGSHVDESAQAIVLAEIAARGFIARGAVFDFTHRLESDERRLQSVAPQPQRFHRRADRARFAAVLVDDDFGLLAGRAEAVAE